MLPLLRMLFKVVFIVFAISVVQVAISVIDFQQGKLKDIDNDIEDIVTRSGYHFENHTLTTDDGYMLQVHRLHAPHLVVNASTPVVFFMHGFLQCSIGWLVASGRHALALRLADSGYDVWLGNARGNRYARRHRQLDPDRQPRAFFNFSWHEVGLHDVPASIDYICDVTRAAKVHVVTHSQGSAVVYAMLAERPEYNRKVRSSVAMAPGVFIKHGFFPTIWYLGVAPKFFEWIFDAIQWYELAPYSDWTALLAMALCNDATPFQPICSFVLGMATGFNVNDWNTTLLSALFTYGPCGASWKQLMHFAQLKNTGRFQLYDEGVAGNLQKYGQERPLEYNLSQVQIPTAIFYGDNDWSIDERDVLMLRNTLPNVDYLHKQVGYAHMDFIIAKSNIQIIDMIEKYLATH